METLLMGSIKCTWGAWNAGAIGKIAIPSQYLAPLHAVNGLTAKCYTLSCASCWH